MRHPISTVLISFAAAERYRASAAELLPALRGIPPQDIGQEEVREVAGGHLQVLVRVMGREVVLATLAPGEWVWSARGMV